MRRSAALCALVLLTLSLILGSAPVGAKPGTSNKLNAKVCQKGGYATLATSADPGTAFATEEACTSYAAMGGTLVAYVAGPRVEVTFTPHNADFCIVTATVFNNPDSHFISVVFSYPDSNIFTSHRFGSGALAAFGVSVGLTVNAVSATVDGVPVPVITTPAVPWTCTA